MLRLTHPFPSLLDGLVVAAIASIAGGDPGVSLRLGVSMTALQSSIGALNDIVDAPRDSGRRPPKPIPGGSVTPRAAVSVVALGATIGVGLALPSGPTAVLVATICLAIGYGYDLRLKGTAWSWLPFALGIPLLPVYGWVGVGSALPSRFLVLLPLAIMAGAALAIANARADLDPDRRTGTDSVAMRLGPDRSWLVASGLLVVVVAAAIGWLAFIASPWPAMVGAVAAGGIMLVGMALGRSADRGHWRLAWEIEAIGLALLAAAWLGGTSAQ